MIFLPIKTCVCACGEAITKAKSRKAKFDQEVSNNNTLELHRYPLVEGNIICKTNCAIIYRDNTLVKFFILKGIIKFEMSDLPLSELFLISFFMYSL